MGNKFNRVRDKCLKKKGDIYPPDSIDEPELNSNPSSNNVRDCPSIPEHEANEEGNDDNEDGEKVWAASEYKALSKIEISCKRGDPFMLLGKARREDWVRVMNLTTKVKGIIHPQFLSHKEPLDCYPWYFSSIDRRTAAAILINEPVGTFMVRDSKSNPGNLVLSVKSNAGRPMVKNYIIANSNGEWSILKGNCYSNLCELLAEYKVNRHGIEVVLKDHFPYKIKPDASIDPKYEVRRDDISQDVKIGAGNFGDVWRGTWISPFGQIDIAIKTLKTGKMSQEKFLEEAEIMKKLEHPNILKLLAVCTMCDPIFIITEYMKNKSLLMYLRGCKKQDIFLPLDTLLGFIHQISKGMEYLEQKNLVHRDLAARNVLVNEHFTCKIADFGLAKVLEEQDSIHLKDKFPIKWSPPESLKGQFSIKSDVWSFGVVCFEIFTFGEPPYAGMTGDEIRRQVSDGYRLSKPSNCTEAIYNVLELCWAHDPSSRPSFSSLAEYFNDSHHGGPDEGGQYLTEIEQFRKS